MNINLESLQLKVYRQTRNVEISAELTSGYKIAGFILLAKEIPYAISQLTGESEILPAYVDGSYLFRPHPNGFCYMATSETRPEWKSVTIPGDFLARHINRAVSNSVGFFQLVESKPIREWRKPDYIYKISSAEIRAEKIRYAARIKLDFADQTIDYKTGETINAKSAILKDFTDVRQTGLIQCLKTIARIARNHSDGQRVTCYISLDHSYRADSPNSYYWYITDETRQSRAKYPQFYMNGGIIAHKNRADETRPGDFWEYRIHT